MRWTPASLSNRIFLACTLLASLSLGFAFAFVNARATREAEEALRSDLRGAAALADQHRTSALTDTFIRLARLVADLPKLKAAVETADPPTVQPLIDDYRSQMNADLLVLSGRAGEVLGTVGAEGAVLPDIGTPASGSEYSLFAAHPRGLLQIVSVPVQVGTGPAEMLGRLTVGFFLDHDRALQFKQLTNSEVVFGAQGRILAASLPPELHADLRGVLDARDIQSVTIGGTEHLALARPMIERTGTVPPRTGAAPVVVVLRSREDQLRFLSTLRAGLGGALLVAVLLATVVSYGVARTITRPLAAVTRAMGDVAETGDLTRRLPVRSRAWDDEDARLLAAAFNTLTESIARFRREETQRERLSSLGRLSTVVAHEIRNPLMIIRASLRALRRDTVSSAELREAVTDIDGETERINRIVTAVLDFARPVRVELAAADLNAICTASAHAAAAGDSEVVIALDLEPSIPTVITDAEQLRTVLVNVLTNARAAVQSATAASGPGLADPPRRPGLASDHAGPADTTITAAITLRTRLAPDAARVVMEVDDTGSGIAEADMPHIFDPYFTTRRAGTGLGLPIAKNIVEGLGGTITATSRVDAGTCIRIEIPVDARETSS